MDLTKEDLTSSAPSWESRKIPTDDPSHSSNCKLGVLLDIADFTNSINTSVFHAVSEPELGLEMEVALLPRSGLISRDVQIPRLKVPTNSAIDLPSESSLPTKANSFSFVPFYRFAKTIALKRDVIYCREDKTPSLDISSNASTDLEINPRTIPANVTKSEDWEKISDDAISRGAAVKRLLSMPSPVKRRASLFDQRPAASNNSADSLGNNNNSSNTDSPSRNGNVIPSRALFDSNFECGNLARVERLTRQTPLTYLATDNTIQSLEEYNLYMDDDPNRRSGSQWFCFRVKNLQRKRRYSFSICNFYKSKSSFTKGMRPVFFSAISNKLDKRIGWTRVGDDIMYRKNKTFIGDTTANDSIVASAATVSDTSVGGDGVNISPAPGGSPLPSTPSGGSTLPKLYTLSFTFDVPFDDDICYFAFSVPYPLSRLQSQICSWMKDEKCAAHLEVFEMCKTLAGNSCPVLRITDNRSPYLPLIYLPGERERMVKQKEDAEIIKRAQMAIRREMKQERRRKKEESRVFFVGKQKMNPHLGVMNWEQELSEDDGNSNSKSNSKSRHHKATVNAPPPAEVISSDDDDEVAELDESVFCSSALDLDYSIRSKRLKPVVVVSARVHPGETVSSFMCEGLIQFLLSDSPAATQMRQRCIFLVIPMLNPDGVVNGFYRTNLSGSDLNRCWDKPSKRYEPTIFRLKSIIADVQKNNRVISYFDFHGHSHKKGIFFYGTRMYSSYVSALPNTPLRTSFFAPVAQAAPSTQITSVVDYCFGEANKGLISTSPVSPPVAQRAPWVSTMWKSYTTISPVEFVSAVASVTRLVNLKHCTAAFPRAVRYAGVARYVTSEELSVPLSFTIEASFHCGSHGPYKRRHFRTKDYRRFGRILGLSIFRTQFSLTNEESRSSLGLDSAAQSHHKTSHHSTSHTTEVEDDTYASSETDEEYSSFYRDYLQEFKTKWWASLNDVGEYDGERDDSDDGMSDGEGDIEENGLSDGITSGSDKANHIRFYDSGAYNNIVSGDNSSSISQTVEFLHQQVPIDINANKHDKEMKNEVEADNNRANTAGEIDATHLSVVGPQFNFPSPIKQFFSNLQDANIHSFDIDRLLSSAHVANNNVRTGVSDDIANAARSSSIQVAFSIIRDAVNSLAKQGNTQGIQYDISIDNNSDNMITATENRSHSLNSISFDDNDSLVEKVPESEFNDSFHEINPRKGELKIDTQEFDREYLEPSDGIKNKDDTLEPSTDRQTIEEDSPFKIKSYSSRKFVQASPISSLGKKIVTGGTYINRAQRAGAVSHKIGDLISYFEQSDIDKALTIMPLGDSNISSSPTNKLSKENKTSAPFWNEKDNEIIKLSRMADDLAKSITATTDALIAEAQLLEEPKVETHSVSVPPKSTDARGSETKLQSSVERKNIRPHQDLVLVASGVNNSPRLSIIPDSSPVKLIEATSKDIADLTKPQNSAWSNNKKHRLRIENSEVKKSKYKGILLGSDDPSEPPNSTENLGINGKNSVAVVHLQIPEVKKGRSIKAVDMSATVPISLTTIHVNPPRTVGEARRKKVSSNAEPIPVESDVPSIIGTKSNMGNASSRNNSSSGHRTKISSKSDSRIQLLDDKASTDPNSNRNTSSETISPIECSFTPNLYDGPGSNDTEFVVHSFATEPPVPPEIAPDNSNMKFESLIGDIDPRVDVTASIASIHNNDSQDLIEYTDMAQHFNSYLNPEEFGYLIRADEVHADDIGVSQKASTFSRYLEAAKLASRCDVCYGSKTLTIGGGIHMCCCQDRPLSPRLSESRKSKTRVAVEIKRPKTSTEFSNTTNDMITSPLEVNAVKSVGPQSARPESSQMRHQVHAVVPEFNEVSIPALWMKSGALPVSASARSRSVKSAGAPLMKSINIDSGFSGSANVLSIIPLCAENSLFMNQKPDKKSAESPATAKNKSDVTHAAHDAESINRLQSGKFEKITIDDYKKQLNVVVPAEIDTVTSEFVVSDKLRAPQDQVANYNVTRPSEPQPSSAPSPAKSRRRIILTGEPSPASVPSSDGRNSIYNSISSQKDGRLSIIKTTLTKTLPVPVTAGEVTKNDFNDDVDSDKDS